MSTAPRLHFKDRRTSLISCQLVPSLCGHIEKLLFCSLDRYLTRTSKNSNDFSLQDILSGWSQIKGGPKVVDKTIFMTYIWLNSYPKGSFLLEKTPANIQRLMSATFVTMKWEYFLVRTADAIIVYEVQNHAWTIKEGPIILKNVAPLLKSVTNPAWIDTID